MISKSDDRVQPARVSPGRQAHSEEPGDAAFEYRGIARYFRSGSSAQVVLRDVDLVVRRHEFLCIVGPSGCGKSTLLNMAAGLLTPSRGEVLCEGRPVKGPNGHVGYVTQRDTLLPWRNVERNVGLPLEVQHVPRAERRRRVGAVLETVGLSKFAGHYPAELSGGMRKRAVLAQTLVYEPDTLLMDEPFGALDAQMRLGLQQEVLRLWERDRKTVLFVTHDLEEAIALGDRVVVFGTHPGRIVHVEDITLQRPRDIEVLRSDPTFMDIRDRLWRLLKPQMEDDGHG